MIPADAKTAHTTVNAMADRYGMSYPGVIGWTRLDDFPEPVDKADNTLLYDEEEVDKWVRLNRPGRWLAGQSGKDLARLLGLPHGDPEDLLTLERIGALEGRYLHREPTPVATLRTYINNTLPPADRVPDDGLTPAVQDPRWFRRTAYRYIARPRKTRSTGAAAVVAREPSPQLVAYLDAHPGMLTAAQVAELDGWEQGLERPTAITSLNNYISRGLLRQPDRKRGDGLEPPVAERMWHHDSVLPFLVIPRRPGRQPSWPTTPPA